VIAEQLALELAGQDKAAARGEVASNPWPAPGSRAFPWHASPSRTAALPCRISPSGQHCVIDLSSLKWFPTPPFCTWCGEAVAE
jgi:hypothetical protein